MAISAANGAAQPSIAVAIKLARALGVDIQSVHRRDVGAELGGDGRDADFLAAVIGDGTIDAAFLDPPYNVKINGHANAKGRHREFAMASGEMTTSAFRTFLQETLGACVAVSRPGAVHFVCMDWRHMDDVSHAGSGLYDDLLNLCVWNKSNAGMGSLYRSKHEMVFVYRVPGASHYNAVELGKHGRNRTNVWDYAGISSISAKRQEELEMHPTVKPVALIADAIKDCSRRGETILDAFGGSGSTLIAAQTTGRVARLIEYDPAYCDTIIRRWEKLTGKHAVHAPSGQRFEDRRRPAGRCARWRVRCHPAERSTGDGRWPRWRRTWPGRARVHRR